MNKKTNIVLIGMPGVGKSTAGVVLAKVGGYQFVDADLLIQKAEGKKLSQIIEEAGVDGFIEVENRVNASIRAKNSVIATGGSVVYGEAAMKHLRNIGTVVYLQTSYRILSNRLRNLKSRGVVLREGQTLKSLYDERIPLYEKYADIVVNLDHLGVEETVECILDKISSMS